jgi:hypothetical protein
VLKKLVLWAVVIFVVYYVATQPGNAGTFVHHCLSGLKTAGSSLATFVNKL